MRLLIVSVAEECWERTMQVECWEMNSVAFADCDSRSSSDYQPVCQKSTLFVDYINTSADLDDVHAAMRVFHLNGKSCNPSVHSGRQ
jgi:hypothetical protein